jgi:hypothetical protein
LSESQGRDVPTTEKPPTRERPTTDLSAAAAIVVQASSRCHRLLDQAVGALAGIDGALFATGPGGSFEAVATHREGSAWREGPLTGAAHWAFQSRHPVLSVVVPGLTAG